jgi:putative thioredoxin
MSDDNPYSSGGTSQVISVQFGAPAPARPSLDLGGTSADDLIKDTTTAAFGADVIQASREQTVLVDFWAPWCGPCKQLTPTLENAVRAAGGRVKLVKMNIDDHPSIPGQLGIQSIPAVIAFKNGQPVDGFMGALPESQVKAFIDKVGGSAGNKDRLAEALAAAEQARAAGDAAGAVEIYLAILEQAPDTVAAIAGAAELTLESGDRQGALDILAGTPADKAEAEPIVALRTRIALSDEAAALGDAAELQSRLAADPKDHDARFDLALVRNAEGDREAAAEALLAIVKADRSWRDDGARAQLLKFFEAWGPGDEATLAARRKLSSLLFS